MTTNMNLKEDRPNLTWVIHQDGLWDIFLGLGILGFALDMAFNTSIWFIPMWLAGYAVVLMVGKELVTRPRLSYFEVKPQHQVNLMKALTSLAVLGTVALLAGMGVFFTQVKGIDPWSEWLGTYGLMLVGLFAALGLAIMAYFGLGGNRYYVFAGLVLLGSIIRQALGTPLLPLVFFIAALLLVSGLLLLLRFILRYPKTD